MDCGTGVSNKDEHTEVLGKKVFLQVHKEEAVDMVEAYGGKRGRIHTD